MTVLVDSGSAILLYRCGLWDTACAAYPLTLSKTVFQELTVENRPGAATFAEDAARGSIRILPDPEAHPALPPSLDAGETAVLSLYLNGGSRFVLTDDGKAARFAMKHGIAFINALLVPRLLAARGWIPEDTVKPFENRLISCGRYSETILRQAGSLTVQNLARFLPDTRSPDQTETPTPSP